MKDKSFANGLKTKKKIEDRKQLITVMIIKALDKGFIKFRFNNKKMMGHTTFRNLFDEVAQENDVLEKFREDKEQIEEQVIQILEKHFNIIFERKRRVEHKENSIEAFDRDEI